MPLPTLTTTNYTSWHNVELNELRTDEHGKVIVSALLRYYKSFAVRSGALPGIPAIPRSTVTDVFTRCTVNP